MSARSVVLAVDIGASKVRVGAFKAERGVLRAKAVERYVSREWNGLVPVLERFVRGAGVTGVEADAVGVAGPVSGNRVTTRRCAPERRSPAIARSSPPTPGLACARSTGTASGTTRALRKAGAERSVRGMPETQCSWRFCSRRIRNT